MKSTIVIREPNQQLPEVFKKMILEQHPAALGFAAPRGDKLVDNETFVSDQIVLADALEQIEQNYKTDRVYYYFLDANLEDGEIDADDLQPFNLLSEGENTLLTVMVEGEFPDFGPREGVDAKTPEYHFVDVFLSPLIDELLDMAGNDIELLMGFLDKKTQKDKIIAKLGPRASLIFIPYKGKALAIANNTEAGTWKWGFSTRQLGYQEEESKKETPSGKPLSLKEKAELRKKGGAPAPEKKEEKLPEGGSPITPEEQYAPILKKKDTFIIRNGVLWVKPPAVKDAAGWKETKAWWNRHTSLDRPKDPKEVYLGFPADKLRPNSPVYDLMQRLIKGEKEPQQADSIQGPTQPEKKENGERVEPAKMTFLIPANQKAAFINMKKNGKLPITTDEDLLNSVGEYPVASLQLGENFGDVLRLSGEALSRLPDHLLRCLVHEMRLRILGIYEEDHEQKEAEEAARKEATGTKPNADKPVLSLKEKAELRKKSQAA